MHLYLATNPISISKLPTCGKILFNLTASTTIIQVVTRSQSCGCIDNDATTIILSCNKLVKAIKELQIRNYYTGRELAKVVHRLAIMYAPQ